MRRLVSALLACLMVLALAVPAFAANARLRLICLNDESVMGTNLVWSNVKADHVFIEVVDSTGESALIAAPDGLPFVFKQPDWVVGTYTVQVVGVNDNQAGLRDLTASGPGC